MGNRTCTHRTARMCWCGHACQRGPHTGHLYSPLKMDGRLSQGSMSSCTRPWMEMPEAIVENLMWVEIYQMDEVLLRGKADLYLSCCLKQGEWEWARCQGYHPPDPAQLFSPILDSSLIWIGAPDKSGVKCTAHSREDPSSRHCVSIVYP